MVSTGFKIWQRGFLEESERTGTWFVWSLRGYPPRWVQGVVTDIFSLQWQGAPWLDQPNWDSDTTCWLQLPGHPWRPEQAHWPVWPWLIAKSCKLPAIDKKLMMSARSGSLAMADHWRAKSWWCPAIGGQKAANLMCNFVWALHWFCTGTLLDKERRSSTFLSLSFHTTECAQRKTGNHNPYHFLQLCNSTGNSIQTNQICWSHMLLSQATGATKLKKALKECVLCVMLDSFPKVILEAQDQTNWQTRIM